jgi:hypothetical protein
MAPRSKTGSSDDLVSKLQESVYRAKLAKINKRVDELLKGQTTGRLGPRTVRARVRFLERDRKDLAADMRRHGYKVN